METRVFTYLSFFFFWVTVNRVACTYEILQPLKAIKREEEATAAAAALERLI